MNFFLRKYVYFTQNLQTLFYRKVVIIMSKNKKNKSNSTNSNTKPQSENCYDNCSDEKTENCEKFQTYYED